MRTLTQKAIGLLGLAVVLTLGCGQHASAGEIIGGFGTLTTDADALVSLGEAGSWRAGGTDDGDHVGVMTPTSWTVDGSLGVDKTREGAMAQMIDNTAGTHSGSRVLIAFDYAMTGSGSPTIKVHLRGWNTTGTSPNWALSLNARNGGMWNNNPFVDGVAYDLWDGTSYAPGSRSSASNIVHGSGTFSRTVDLSGDTLGDVSDYEYLAVGFQVDWPVSNNDPVNDVVVVANLTVETLPDTTIMKDFGALTLDSDLSIANIDGDWHAGDLASGGYADHEGVMTANSLTVDNAPFESSSRKYECPVAKIIDNTAGTHSGSLISFSFDYTVALGSPSLYFYLRGVDVTGASPAWSINYAARGGNAWHSETDVETYCLFDGLADRTGVGGSTSGSSDWAYNTGLTDLADSGTISVTINLSTHGTYQDLSEYEYIAANFAWDFDEAGVIEVSNLTVDIVPPGGTVFVVR